VHAQNVPGFLTCMFVWMMHVCMAGGRCRSGYRTNFQAWCLRLHGLARLFACRLASSVCRCSHCTRVGVAWFGTDSTLKNADVQRCMSVKCPSLDWVCRQLPLVKTAFFAGSQAVVLAVTLMQTLQSLGDCINAWSFWMFFPWVWKTG
jgi:hypothetical protein